MTTAEDHGSIDRPMATPISGVASERSVMFGKPSSHPGGCISGVGVAAYFDEVARGAIGQQLRLPPARRQRSRMRQGRQIHPFRGGASVLAEQLPIDGCGHRRTGSDPGRSRVDRHAVGDRCRHRRTPTPWRIASERRTVRSARGRHSQRQEWICRSREARRPAPSLPERVRR